MWKNQNFGNEISLLQSPDKHYCLELLLVKCTPPVVGGT
jgi:hypothetical protein